MALPTGYGKSVIFGILPAAYDILRVHTESKSIAIVARLDEYSNGTTGTKVTASICNAS